MSCLRRTHEGMFLLPMAARVHGARHSVHWSVSWPTQGGGLLGLSFTLQVQPQGGAPTAAVHMTVFHMLS